MTAGAHKTLGTELQMTITATLTEIPFLDNIEVDLGENKMHSLLGVNMAYETPIATGVRGTGSISADVLAWDPTDAVHQKVAEAYNDQSEVVGAYKVAGSGKTIAVYYTITKFPTSSKAASVVSGKLEAVITRKAEMPES